MLVFKHKRFHLWAKSERLTDTLLKKAVQEMNEGLYEVNLGSGLFKKRLPRPGQGKSSGYRTLIVFKSKERAIFVYGFAKNEKENIGVREKEAYKILSHYYLDLTEEELENLVQKGELIEVTLHEKKA